MTTCVICGAIDVPCPHDDEPNYFTALRRDDLLQALAAERRVKEATQKVCYEKDRELALEREKVRTMREALTRIATPVLADPILIAAYALGWVSDEQSGRFRPPAYSMDDDGRCLGCGNKGGGCCMECTVFRKEDV